MQIHFKKDADSFDYFDEGIFLVLFFKIIKNVNHIYFF